MNRIHSTDSAALRQRQPPRLDDIAVNGQPIQAHDEALRKNACSAPVQPCINSLKTQGKRTSCE